jgi:hypothetical protein
MTVPDYIISQTIVVEHQRRERRHTANPGLPEARPRTKASSERLATLRRQMSLMLRVAADRIEPPPHARARQSG